MMAKQLSFQHLFLEKPLKTERQDIMCSFLFFSEKIKDWGKFFYRRLDFFDRGHDII